jgi:hypothetical protein
VTALLTLLAGARRLLPALPYAAIALLGALCWHFDRRAVANADAVRTQAAQFRQAQADAQKAAQQALDRENTAYQAKATEAQNAYQAQLADAHSAADQYIATHRVQPAPAGSHAGTAAAPTDGGSASVPSAVPADAVVVSADDVQACTGAVTYALQAHDWAATLNEVK